MPVKQGNPTNLYNHLDSRGKRYLAHLLKDQEVFKRVKKIDQAEKVHMEGDLLDKLNSYEQQSIHEKWDKQGSKAITNLHGKIIDELIPIEFFDWLDKENIHQLLWFICLINTLLDSNKRMTNFSGFREEYSIHGTSHTSVPIPPKEYAISLFDRIEVPNIQLKTVLITQIQDFWPSDLSTPIGGYRCNNDGKIDKRKQKQAPLEWIDSRNDDQIEWLKGHLISSGYWIPNVYPSNKNEQYQLVCACISCNLFTPTLKLTERIHDTTPHFTMQRDETSHAQMFLITTKKSWSQQKYRIANKAYTPGYAPMTDKTKSKLKEITSRRNEKIQHVLEDLIEQEYQRLKKRNKPAFKD